MIEHRSDCSILKATKADIASVKSWFHNDDELAQWGGPGLRLNVDLNDFAAQIKLDELNSYTLSSPDGDILGFGQFYVRVGRHHFGRLAIAPEHRGKKLASVLLTKLAGQALLRQSANGFSLFVLEHNKPALKTYQNLGFRFACYPEELTHGLENCRYMVTDSLQ